MILGVFAGASWVGEGLGPAAAAGIVIALGILELSSAGGSLGRRWRTGLWLVVCSVGVLFLVDVAIRALAMLN